VSSREASELSGRWRPSKSSPSHAEQTTVSLSTPNPETLLAKERLFETAPPRTEHVGDAHRHEQHAGRGRERRRDLPDPRGGKSPLPIVNIVYATKKIRPDQVTGTSPRAASSAFSPPAKTSVQPPQMRPTHVTSVSVRMKRSGETERPGARVTDLPETPPYPRGQPRRERSGAAVDPERRPEDVDDGDDEQYQTDDEIHRAYRLAPCSGTRFTAPPTPGASDRVRSSVSANILTGA